MYRKFFKTNSDNKITCKICSSKMSRSNMVRHFKIKHQFKEKSITEPGRKTSPWSKYCVEVGENKYQCVICFSVLNMPKAHGNMKRHIKFKHPKVFEKETKDNLKTFWKQFGVNSEDDEPKTAEQNQEVLEVEEVVLGEAEYLEEYMEDETAPIVTSDPGKETNSMEEVESGEKETMVETELVSTNESDTNAVENQIISENIYQAVDKIVDFGELDYVSEDDEKFEQKIRWLADRAVPGRRGFRTRIWNFFKEIKRNRIYQCKICRRKLAGFSSSSSNLKRHIALVHARAYKIIANCPNFRKIPKGTIDKLEKFIIEPAEKSFETSYFEDQGDNKYKCKVCDDVIHSELAGSLLLFKHISEEHSEEVVGGIEEPVGDEQEVSVLFVKRKDLQLS